MHLGVTIVQEDKLAATVWVGLPFYTERIIQNFQMYNSKLVGSPVNLGTKLAASKDPGNMCNQ